MQNRISQKKDFISHKSDCVGSELDCDAALRFGFNTARNGREQTKFAAGIVLSKHPELRKQYSNIRKDIYSINDIIEQGLSRKGINNNTIVDTPTNDLFKR